MKTKVSSSAVFGIILIAVGVIWFLNTLGYIDAYDATRMFWPGILILFGVKAMIDYRSSTLFGMILTLIGVMFIVDNLGYAFLGQVEMHEMIIPMIVILIGLNFILPKNKKDIDESVSDVPPVQATKVTPPTPPTPPVPPHTAVDDIVMPTIPDTPTFDKDDEVEKVVDVEVE